MFSQVIECIPNFSEGKDSVKLQRIIAPFYQDEHIRVLDCHLDADHNRAVVTVIGSYEGLKRAVPCVIGLAQQEIDLRVHRGAHPRMGATDVCPFVPIRNSDMGICIKLAREVAEIVAADYKIPVFLYGKSATSPERENLAKIRKGEFEGMKEKMLADVWKPDFGPARPHETAGVTAIGAREPLIAYNINLGTSELKIADEIARKVRYIGGGLRFVKAMGVALKQRNIVQVSMNLTDYTKSSLYQVMELIRSEARRYGVAVVGSEIVGLSPLEALIDVASYYLQLENFSTDRVIESRLLDMEQ
ncbi:MAG: glutamate formimidoyltransferase [Saccharofermentanales bacterium]|jgi:glutamate formiminotransferase|nr:glutamate formimidoyltransferase [Bacillota bacterium]